MTPIAVGIPSASVYPAQVLEQLGICARRVDSLAEGVASGLRVFFWNRSEDIEQPGPPGEALAIVTDHGCMNPAEPSAGQPCFFRMAAGPLAGRSFYASLPAYAAKGETFGACHGASGQAMLRTGIGVQRHGGRLVVALPWDLFGHTPGAQWWPRPYYSASARRHFVEVGPAIDGGALRRLILDALLMCFRSVGCPLVRVSSHYRNQRWFSFRIDADGFSPDSTRAALRVAEQVGLRFTWFLDMGAWKADLDCVSGLAQAGQDVQFHCFRHLTYVSRRVNELNIRKGLKLLRRAGIRPNAIVSPTGYHYRGFAEAAAASGFAYTSEFGFGADDLPSYPWNDRRLPLQVPVHPACSSMLEVAGFEPDTQFEHLRRHALALSAVDGVCLLYDHPIAGIDRHEDRYGRLFKGLLDEGLSYICMSDYCRAWTGRPANADIRFENGQLCVADYQGNGFDLEQVVDDTREPVAGIQWRGALLPQRPAYSAIDRFERPDSTTFVIQNGMHRRALLHARERNCSPLAWRIRQALQTVSRLPGGSYGLTLIQRLRWRRTREERLIL